MASELLACIPPYHPPLSQTPPVPPALGPGELLQRGYIVPARLAPLRQHSPKQWPGQLAGFNYIVYLICMQITISSSSRCGHRSNCLTVHPAGSGFRGVGPVLLQQGAWKGVASLHAGAPSVLPWIQALQLSADKNFMVPDFQLYWKQSVNCSLVSCQHATKGEQTHTTYPRRACEQHLCPRAPSCQSQGQPCPTAPVCVPGPKSGSPGSQRQSSVHRVTHMGCHMGIRGHSGQGFPWVLTRAAAAGLSLKRI